MSSSGLSDSSVVPKQGIDDAAVRVNVLVERIAETVDETDGAETSIVGDIGAAFDNSCSACGIAVRTRLSSVRSPGMSTLCS